MVLTFVDLALLLLPFLLLFYFHFWDFPVAAPKTTTAGTIGRIWKEREGTLKKKIQSYYLLRTWKPPPWKKVMTLVEGCITFVPRSKRIPPLPLSHLPPSQIPNSQNQIPNLFSSYLPAFPNLLTYISTSQARPLRLPHLHLYISTFLHLYIYYLFWASLTHTSYIIHHIHHIYHIPPTSTCYCCPGYSWFLYIYTHTHTPLPNLLSIKNKPSPSP